MLAAVAAGLWSSNAFSRCTARCGKSTGHRVQHLQLISLSCIVTRCDADRIIRTDLTPAVRLHPRHGCSLSVECRVRSFWRAGEA